MSGYAFGKGVYFADMFAKSFNYCRINQYHHYDHDKKKKAPDNVGFLLLSEVALGKMNKIREAAYMEKAPAGTDSTKGVFLLSFFGLGWHIFLTCLSIYQLRRGTTRT